MTLLLRPGRLEDLEPLTALYNHYILTSAITFDIDPWTVDKRRTDWFSHYHSSGPHQLLVAASDDAVLGYATSSSFRSRAAYATSVETSVYLSPEACGQGLGTRLYLALFEALSEEDVHRAYAGIALPNAASIRMHEKLGFSCVGVYTEVGRKFGRYHDVAWYERGL